MWPQSISAISLILALVVFTDSAFVQDVLYNNLFHGYNKNIRPVAPDQTMEVYVDLFLKGVETHLENQNDVMLTMYMLLNWTDANLRWRPRDYNGLTCIFVSQSEVWMPDIGVYYSRLLQELSTDEMSPKVQLCYTGTVFAYFWLRVLVIGQFDMTEYPFDHHKVNFTVGSAMMSSNHITLKTVPNSFMFNNSDTQPNDEFEIYAQGCKQGVLSYTRNYPFNPWSYLECSLKLKRHPIFHIYIFYMPNMVVTLLLICGIYTRSVSKGNRFEKFRLGLHAMLAFIVAMNFLSETVPHSPKGIPLIARIYFSLLFIALLSTLISWIEIKLEQCGHEERRIPRCLAWSLVYVILPEQHSPKTFLELCGRLRRTGYKEGLVLVHFMEILTISLRLDIDRNRRRLKRSSVQRYWFRLANVIGTLGFILSFTTWVAIGVWVLAKYHIHTWNNLWHEE